MAQPNALVPLADTAQASARPATSENLVDQLVDRWANSGAPAAMLRKAERASPGFAARHAPIRTDRLRLQNAAWLFACAAIVATTGLTAGLIELPIMATELLVRMLVAALLVALACTCLSRSSIRLPAYLFCLAALSLIYLAARPDNFALRTWDLNAVLLGWGIVVGKSLRIFLDGLLDRMEAELLLRAAGCR